MASFRVEAATGALASPRHRRRLVGVLGVVVLGACVAAAVLIGNTAEPPLPLTDRPPILEQRRPLAALSGADRKEILVVGRLFVQTAVKRVHPERAWPLASDALRSGTSLAEWKAGTLPLPPYPVRTARWNIAYSVQGEAGLDVMVESTDPDLGPLVYRLTVVRSPRSSGPTWLVDGWTAISLAAGGFVESPWLDQANDAGAANAESPTPRPSGLWVLAPFLVLLAALLIPLAIVLGSRRAERRTHRR